MKSQVEHYYNEFFVSFSRCLTRHLTMSCNEKVLKLNHWKVELDSTNTHTYIELELAIERAPGLLNLIEFNLTKAEQVSALTKYHTHTHAHTGTMIREIKVTKFLVTFEILWCSKFTYHVLPGAWLVCPIIFPLFVLECRPLVPS